MSKFWYSDQIEWYAVFRSDSSYKSQQDTQQTITCDTLNDRSGWDWLLSSSYKTVFQVSAMNMYFLVTLNIDFTRAISCFQNERMHLFITTNPHIERNKKLNAAQNFRRK